jgi:hypothetical protein
VWLVSRTIQGFAIHSQALHEIAHDLHTRGIVPSSLDDGYRLIMTLNVSGVRGWTEMALADVVQPSTVPFRRR